MEDKNSSSSSSAHEPVRKRLSFNHQRILNAYELEEEYRNSSQQHPQQQDTQAVNTFNVPSPSLEITSKPSSLHRADSTGSTKTTQSAHSVHSSSSMATIASTSPSNNISAERPALAKRDLSALRKKIMREEHRYNHTQTHPPGSSSCTSHIHPAPPLPPRPTQRFSFEQGDPEPAPTLYQNKRISWPLFKTSFHSSSSSTSSPSFSSTNNDATVDPITKNSAASSPSLFSSTHSVTSTILNSLPLTKKHGYKWTQRQKRNSKILHSEPESLFKEQQTIELSQKILQSNFDLAQEISNINNESTDKLVVEEETVDPTVLQKSNVRFFNKDVLSYKQQYLNVSDETLDDGESSSWRGIRVDDILKKLIPIYKPRVSLLSKYSEAAKKQSWAVKKVQDQDHVQFVGEDEKNRYHPLSQQKSKKETKGDDDDDSSLYEEETELEEDSLIEKEIDKLDEVLFQKYTNAKSRGRSISYSFHSGETDHHLHIKEKTKRSDSVSHKRTMSISVTNGSLRYSPSELDSNVQDMNDPMMVKDSSENLSQDMEMEVLNPFVN